MQSCLFISFIRYLIEKDYPGIRVGPEPTTDKFMVIMGGDRQQSIPGNALVADPEKQFQDLSRFGNAFLRKLHCSVVNEAPILRSITFVDTPGILSGEKQRAQREYDFYEALNWFADRSDMVVLTFDANKLDISDELKAAIDILKVHDSKLRIVLNKADTIDERSLLRVHGALMWALGKTIVCPEVPRVYVGSFWDKPYTNVLNRRMFSEEESDLFQDIRSLPHNSVVSKLNYIGKRAKLAIIHAYIISELSSRMTFMSRLWYKKDQQKNIIENLHEIYLNVLNKYKHLSESDFPNIKKLKTILKQKDFTNFKSLDEKLINRASNLLDGININISVDDIEVNSNVIPDAKDTTTPFNIKSHGFDEGQFEDVWIVEYYRKPFSEIFDKLEKHNGKVIRSAVKEEMLKTKLPDSVLSKIWKMADVDKDGVLDADEFALAMYLAKIKLEGSELPPVLPIFLVPPSKRNLTPKLPLRISTSEPTN
ncbi:EH domain-containing protein 4-like isoform X2 [Daktulosphaira vitifoliae]|uniref:EH domain-containing protein 4-like isoform X2 n=1 Tax=Daktulosphaira vitifoliae TaxID=58002 RepID=UPI0021AAA87C|nr:EH domain-containing protein 4-like isoform X2 [Daktulosphaira vitifoliae]